VDERVEVEKREQLVGKGLGLNKKFEKPWRVINLAMRVPRVYLFKGGGEYDVGWFIISNLLSLFFSTSCKVEAFQWQGHHSCQVDVLY